MSHYDVFISHASEDKEPLVQPLATALRAMGAEVWYDAFTLVAGDSLSRSIDRGLSDSRYGLVVLSQAFICKPWPEYELRGLVSKELGRDAVIIPLWFGVSRDEVLAFSPPLADRFAIDASSSCVDEVAAEVLRIVRPDRYAEMHRLLLAGRMDDCSFTASPKRIAPGKLRHASLPKILMSRFSLIWHAFSDVLPGTPEALVDQFRRDAHPEQELVIWEAMAAVYLDFKRRYTPTAASCNAALGLLLELSMAKVGSRKRKGMAPLTADEFKFIRRRWDTLGSHVPLGVSRMSSASR